MEKVNLTEALSRFSKHWEPKIVGELNGQHVRLAKLKGSFIWHSHEEEDELFLVLKGSLVLKFRNQTVTVNEGEFIIVPHGVEHLPVAKEEVHVLLFEPASTINTGKIRNEKTIEKLERITDTRTGN